MGYYNYGSSPYNIKRPAKSKTRGFYSNYIAKNNYSNSYYNQGGSYKTNNQGTYSNYKQPTYRVNNTNNKTSTYYKQGDFNNKQSYPTQATSNNPAASYYNQGNYNSKQSYPTQAINNNSNTTNPYYNQGNYNNRQIYSTPTANNSNNINNSYYRQAAYSNYKQQYQTQAVSYNKNQPFYNPSSRNTSTNSNYAANYYNKSSTSLIKNKEDVEDVEDILKGIVDYITSCNSLPKIYKNGIFKLQKLAKKYPDQVRKTVLQLRQYERMNKRAISSDLSLQFQIILSHTKKRERV